MEEIRRLRFVKNLHERYLCSDGFLYQEEYLYIKVAFEQKENKPDPKEKWHQIVRFALNYNKEEQEYMYKRLLQLLVRHRKSYKNYFILKSEKGTTLFPDRVSDINRLFILYEQYFQIFYNIIKKIHFDYPLTFSSELAANGSIDWERTLRKTPFDFPLSFETSKWKREFDVSENILLVLPSFWLNHESKRLLNAEFAEPLRDGEKSTLNIIAKKTRDIVFFFPFHKLLHSVKRFAHLAYDDTRIKELERITELRISRGIVRADVYRRLLYWIKEFRELNLRMMTNARTNFPLDTIKNLDTIYEAWLFFEFVDYFSNIGVLITLEIDSEPNYFEINLAGHRIKFYHEMMFNKNDGHAWTVNSNPDFVAMENDTILGVFDAKNYGPDSMLKGEALHKILAYLTNLDCGYGGLFFPNIKSTVEMSYPPENHFARHHFGLKVGHYLMKPSDSDDAIATKSQTMQYIFAEIINRAHLDMEVFKPLMKQYQKVFPK